MLIFGLEKKNNMGSLKRGLDSNDIFLPNKKLYVDRREDDSLIKALPDELWCLISTFLPQKDFVKMFLLSKEMRNILFFQRTKRYRTNTIKKKTNAEANLRLYAQDAHLLWLLNVLKVYNAILVGQMIKDAFYDIGVGRSYHFGIIFIHNKYYDDFERGVLTKHREFKIIPMGRWEKGFFDRVPTVFSYNYSLKPRRFNNDPDIPVVFNVFVIKDKIPLKNAICKLPFEWHKMIYFERDEIRFPCGMPALVSVLYP